MLSDLDAAYTPDCGAWFEHHGFGSAYAPGALDMAALRGLDVASLPHLAAEADGFREVPGRRLEQFCGWAMAFDRLPGPASWVDAGRRYMDAFVARHETPLSAPLVK